MCIWKKNLGILLVIFIELYTQVVSKVEIQLKAYDFTKGKKQIVYGPVDSEEGLVYAFCTKYDAIEPLSEEDCTVISGSSPDDLRFCNVTIKSSANRNIIRRFFDVHSFGRDKVILQWEEEVSPGKLTSFRYGIVEHTNCKLTPISVIDHLNLGVSVAVPLNEHIFDIRFQNFDECENSCRITFDDEGKVVADPRNDLNSSEYVSISYSPTQGRLVVLLPFPYIKENLIQVASEDINGTMKILKEFPVENDKYTVSTTYQLLTICSAINLTVYCGQFNDNGALKFENVVQINRFNDLHEIKIHNIFDGGFLLLFNTKGSQEVFATFVNAAGQQGGTIQLPQFSYSFLGSDFRSFLNKDKENCLAKMNENKNNLTFDYVCFKSDDFVIASK